MLEDDDQARTQALDPSQSFIVQAPAGSGKTELLTQRYLSLLAKACISPEEIIAITFTRKAAMEMQERVLSALQSAQHSQGPSAAHKHQAWLLARTVLEKDAQNQWNLLENPQRLRILTIDSLCAELSKRLPILSGLGALANIIEDPNPVYEQAVRQWIMQETPSTLLAHLDNDLQKLMRLCVELLGKREQWLPYIRHNISNLELRQQLENGMAQMAHEILAAAQSQIDTKELLQLQELLRFAGKNLQTQQNSHPFIVFTQLTRCITTDPQDLEIWQALTQALLTAEGQWRKQVNINLGFPPKSPEKTIFLELLSQLSQNEILAENLRQIRQCPPIRFHEQQWQMLSALVEMLPSLCAHLQIIFQQNHLIDFVELGLCAHRALGEAQEPTDLALALDYQIRHILVDEFQDTSITQFNLLEKLLQGWEIADGRTLFLVGDPMQSIYRFRNAEVGLFLLASQTGLQHIVPTPLTLTRNFRSNKGLIDWFNQIFSQLFPDEANIDKGAIPYSPAFATQKQTEVATVNFKPFFNDDDEAKFILETIQHLQLTQPTASIAILVRTRSHLACILKALQKHQIQFQAVDIEPLINRSEIQDLAALTRALHHLGDRIAWLALLRAPYCGLKLVDLHCIAVAARNRHIFEVLVEFACLNNLSEDARLRLERIVPVLSQSLSQRGRLNLSEWVETTWQKLGGAAVLETAQECLNVQSFFKLLQENQTELQIFSKTLLIQKINKLHAAANPQANNQLQIMTIHKAKGLEFDHVFLPQLHRCPAKEKHRLLLWTQRTFAHGGSHLLLAPIKASSAANDPLYDFLHRTERKKLTHEAQRLLYVAATRAKQTLHLTAVIENFQDNQVRQANPGSFLEMLWPFFQAEIKPHSLISLPAAVIIHEREKALFRRLTHTWRPSESKQEELKSSSKQRLESTEKFADDFFEDKIAAHIGVVVHEALADLGEKFPDLSNILSDEHFRRRLWQLGISGTELEKALGQVKQARQNMLQDPQGLWILSAQHQERKNEYARSAIINGQIIRVVIDRTFVDNQGIRWIIDYKTGALPDLNRYYEQLGLYAKVLSLEDPRPIKTALYFPLSCHFLDCSQACTSFADSGAF